MLRVIAFLLFALTAGGVSAAEPAVAAKPAAKSEVVAPAAGPDMRYPLALAAGAVAGVVAMNMLTYGVGTIPLSMGAPSTAPIISPAAAAASRIFVITSGVVGAWIADALYPKKAAQ
mgnify:CR=1 FL=1